MRDVALSLKGHSKEGHITTGNVWFQVEGPVTKDIIGQAAQDYCLKAADKGATLLPEDLMIVNVFIAENA